MAWCSDLRTAERNSRTWCATPEGRKDYQGHGALGAASGKEKDVRDAPHAGCPCTTCEFFFPRGGARCTTYKILFPQRSICRITPGICVSLHGIACVSAVFSVSRDGRVLLDRHCARKRIPHRFTTGAGTLAQRIQNLPFAEYLVRFIGYLTVLRGYFKCVFTYW